MSRAWVIPERLLALALAFGVAGGALADMDACREIVDAEARLACFDQLAAGRTPAAGTAEASGRGQAAEQATIRDLAITELGTDAYGRLVITLEDGAIWRQVDDRRTTLSTSDRVSIRQTAFGGWHMRDVGSSKRSIQVTRIEPGTGN